VVIVVVTAAGMTVKQNQAALAAKSSDHDLTDLPPRLLAAATA
jgi:hypothetical protein